MKKIKLSNSLEVSRLVHGQMRLNDWGYTPKEFQQFITELVEMGITTFDHADIYGDYSCEKAFGELLKSKPFLRHKMQIITKCGIKLVSPKFPDRSIKYYDYSLKHIINSVENSLQNLNTNYIDLLLLHRPSPFMNPYEVAEAFEKLHQEGKVLNFGVSNFSPSQFEMLQTNTNQKLVTNQVEISPFHLEHFHNGNLDFFLKKMIQPMAWSPLSGGRIVHNNKSRIELIETLKQMAEQMKITIEQLMIAWLINHPVKIIPVIGSGKLKNIVSLLEAIDINLTTEQWFQIYTPATGKELP